MAFQESVGTEQCQPTLRRVRMGDLTTLKYMHDRCFPIVYPEEFYRKLLTPLWVAIVAVVPFEEEAEEEMKVPNQPFGALGGLGLVGTKIGASSPPPPPAPPRPSQGDRIIGFITGTGKVLCTSIIPVPVGYISTFGVEPSYRRGGVGEQLFNAFMRAIRYHYNFRELRSFRPEDAANQVAGASPNISNSNSSAHGKGASQATDAGLLHPVGPPRDSQSFTERCLESVLHTSPLAMAALGLVRLAARVENLLWYLKGRKAGERPPRHDRRIFHDNKDDVTQVWLHVLATNTNAINFYKKRNFKVVKYLSKFYNFNNADHDGIIMCYDLAAERQLGHEVRWDIYASGEAIQNGANADHTTDTLDAGYNCSFFAHSGVTYQRQADDEHRLSNAHSKLTKGGEVGIARRTVSPQESPQQQHQQQASASEEQLLQLNCRRTFANRLYQFFTTGSLSATFDSLDNIEEAEQSNSIQWLLCAMIVVATTVMGAGAFTIMTITSPPQKARRSLHSK